jgi:hypothetical protein
MSVITDDYFHDARDASREAQEQLGNADLQYNAKVAWELARSSAWAYTYYLAKKGRLDQVFAYGKELDKLPRDMDLNEQILQTCYGKAFNLADARDATRLDEIKLQNEAIRWFDEIAAVNLDPSMVQTYYAQLRSKEDEGRSTGAVVSNPGNTGGGPRPNPGGKTPAWQEFNSTEGGYSVQFPGMPVEKSDDIPTPAGKVKATAQVLELDQGREFGVAYFDGPAGTAIPDAALDTILELMAKENKAAIKSTKKITLGGNSGREALLESPKDGFARIRVFRAGNRAYLLFGTWDPTKGGTPADADTFMNSFRFTGGSGNADPNPGGVNPQPAPGGNPGGINPNPNPSVRPNPGGIRPPNPGPIRPPGGFRPPGRPGGRP